MANSQTGATKRDFEIHLVESTAFRPGLSARGRLAVDCQKDVACLFGLIDIRICTARVIRRNGRTPANGTGLRAHRLLSPDLRISSPRSPSNRRALLEYSRVSIPKSLLEILD